jgi:signal transduction histidine kinase
MTTGGDVDTLVERNDGGVRWALDQRVDQRLAKAPAIGHIDPRDVGRQLSRARISGAASERRRLARDLHDGVQNDLVALIVELAGAAEDRDTTPALAVILLAHPQSIHLAAARI